MLFLLCTFHILEHPPIQKSKGFYALLCGDPIMFDLTFWDRSSDRGKAS